MRIAQIRGGGDCSEDVRVNKDDTASLKTALLLNSTPVEKNVRAARAVAQVVAAVVKNQEAEGR